MAHISKINEEKNASDKSNKHLFEKIETIDYIINTFKVKQVVRFAHRKYGGKFKFNFISITFHCSTLSILHTSIHLFFKFFVWNFRLNFSK